MGRIVRRERGRRSEAARECRVVSPKEEFRRNRATPSFGAEILRSAQNDTGLARRENAASFGLLLMAALLLVGCSSGAAVDAYRDQARDAGLKDKLAPAQATRTVQRYFPATGTPEPTQAPAPALGGLAITFGFRPDGTPDGSYASVPAGIGTAYAAVRLTGVSAGQVVKVVVTDAWGNEVTAPEAAIDPGASDRWIALPIGLPGELQTGQYGMFVFADDHPLGSLSFGVTGVGTSAQLFPEAPANPRVRSTQPPPGAAPGEGQPTPTVAPAA